MVLPLLALIQSPASPAPSAITPTSLVRSMWAIPTQSPGDTTKSRRKRGRVSRAADFFGAGLLQLEYGYDGAFHAPDTRRDEAGAATLLFNTTEDTQLEVDFDTFHAITDASGARVSGIGDATVGLQVTAFAETPRHPSVAVAYSVKLPTASASRGLGSGRTDHKLTLLVSRSLGGVAIDCNASLLVNGAGGGPRRIAGFQAAFGLSRDLARGLSLEAEIFGENLDTDQPPGRFLQGGVTYEPNRQVSFDLGARVGLSSDAPHAGLFGGVSVSVTNFYR